MDERMLLWISIGTAILGMIVLIPLTYFLPEYQSESDAAINGTIFSSTGNIISIVPDSLTVISSKPAFLSPGMRAQFQGNIRKYDGKIVFFAEKIQWE